MLAVDVSAATDASTRFIDCVPNCQSYKACHIKFTLLIYYMMVISGGGRVTGKKTSKPVTTVQACILTCVRVKPINLFNKNSGQFPAVFMVTKPRLF